MSRSNPAKRHAGAGTETEVRRRGMCIKIAPHKRGAERLPLSREGMRPLGAPQVLALGDVSLGDGKRLFDIRARFRAAKR